MLSSDEFMVVSSGPFKPDEPVISRQSLSFLCVVESSASGSSKSVGDLHLPPRDEFAAVGKP